MRQTQRRKSSREQVDVSSAAPELRANRRFFQAGGFQKNVRAARALENAFKSGSEMVTDMKFEANAKGQRQALAERGQGNVERDEDNKQAGYLRTWDKLDAEFDANQTEIELKEVLRGADWENLPEEQVQEIINNHLSSNENYKGLENLADSAYAQTLAPRMLELETNLIEQHRGMQIEKIKHDQRSKLFANARVGLEKAREADPEAQLDYQTLFTDTGVIFDGPEKKEMFWQMVYDLGINLGDPELIENVPEMMNGVPSGISDPKLLAAHRAAIAAATNQGAKMLAAKEKLQKEQHQDDLFELQLAIAHKKIAGQDYSRELLALQQNPEAKFGDYSSAVSMGRAQLNENDQRSQDVDFTAGLWKKIHSGNSSVEEIFQAHAHGYLGTGKQSNGTLDDMMSTLAQVREGNKRGNSSTISTMRSEVMKRYPSIMNAMGGVDPKMQHIQYEALAMYNGLVIQEGKSPMEATELVYAKFDEMVDKLGAATFSEDQDSFSRNNERVSAGDFKNILEGKVSASDLFAGLRPHTRDDILFKAVDDGTITEEQAIHILNQL